MDVTLAVSKHCKRIWPAVQNNRGSVVINNNRTADGRWLKCGALRCATRDFEEKNQKCSDRQLAMQDLVRGSHYNWQNYQSNSKHYPDCERCLSFGEAFGEAA